MTICAICALLKPLELNFLSLDAAGNARNKLKSSILKWLGKSSLSWFSCARSYLEHLVKRREEKSRCKESRCQEKARHKEYSVTVVSSSRFLLSLLSIKGGSRHNFSFLPLLLIMAGGPGDTMASRSGLLRSGDSEFWGTELSAERPHNLRSSNSSDLGLVWMSAFAGASTSSCPSCQINLSGFLAFGGMLLFGFVNWGVTVKRWKEEEARTTTSVIAPWSFVIVSVCNINCLLPFKKFGITVKRRKNILFQPVLFISIYIPG